MEPLQVGIAGVSLVAAGTAAIVGVIEAVKAIFPKPGEARDWRTFAIIIAAMATGAGLASLMEIRLIYGLYVGVSAAGVYTLVKS